MQQYWAGDADEYLEKKKENKAQSTSYIRTFADLPCVVQQYWAGDAEAYAFVGVSQLAQAFKDSGISSDHSDDNADLEAGKHRGRLAETKNWFGKTERQRDGAHGQDGIAKHADGIAKNNGQDGDSNEELDPLVHAR